jgi:hypothetical protein
MAAASAAAAAAAAVLRRRLRARSMFSLRTFCLTSFSLRLDAAVDVVILLGGLLAVVDDNFPALAPVGHIRPAPVIQC